jgi:hypothetical protein
MRRIAHGLRKLWILYKLYFTVYLKNPITYTKNPDTMRIEIAKLIQNYIIKLVRLFKFVENE